MDELDAAGIELTEEEKECLYQLGISFEYASQMLREFEEDWRDLWQELGNILSGASVRRRPKWPRPKNDRIKPLMMDRRPKLHKCRNNC